MLDIQVDTTTPEQKHKKKKKRRTRVPPGRDLGAGTDEGRREDLTPQKVQGRDLETIIWEKFMEKPKQKTTLSRQAGWMSLSMLRMMLPWQTTYSALSSICTMAFGCEKKQRSCCSLSLVFACLKKLKYPRNFSASNPLTYCTWEPSELHLRLNSRVLLETALLIFLIRNVTNLEDVT